jgi:hypothetical protein
MEIPKELLIRAQAQRKVKCHEFPFDAFPEQPFLHPRLVRSPSED